MANAGRPSAVPPVQSPPPLQQQTSPAGPPRLSALQAPGPSLSSKLTFGHWSISSAGYRKLPDDELPVQPRSSILLPHLQQSEKKFFELVAANEVPPVIEFLQQNEGFNVNCVNFQGVSALHIALQNRSESMVEFLVSQPNIDIGDCVLHAVRDNLIKILQMLLDKLQETAPGLEFVGVTHSSDFPDHVTPLILAAQCGHFEIIELLIERGHKIAKPHPPDCKCGECMMHLQHDDLLHGETLRLNLYRAITNPAYICHSTHDPILTSFELSRELTQCSFMVPEFRVAYQELAQEISAFAVELIACCRSTEEMDLILRQKSGISASGVLYPRLLLAMNYKQKGFVSHPNTQQMIEATWHGDWYEWKYKHGLIRCIYPLIRLVLLPFIAILCLLMPRHSWVKHWAIPLNKMITHNASYFLFLIVLLIESNLDKTGQRRGPPNSGLEPLIILYVVGHVWGSFRLCMMQGPKRHFKIMWNSYDVIMYVLFALTFVFWLASYMDVKQNGQADLERKYWHHLDPELIAEGCFAIAVIMSYFRLLYLCRLNYYLGPLQISLGKMSADIAKYLVIFTLILISFSAGMCRFYQYYDGMVKIGDNGVSTSQNSSFVNFSAALKIFFWAIFCMAPLEAADVVIENLPGEKEKTTITNHHEFTEAIGYMVYGTFEVLIVIMLLNMLIATISNTYQRVTDNVDVEWTFGKTDLYIEYMLQTTLPPPLNLIPTAQGISSCIEWLQVASKNPPGKVARCTPSNCCYIESELDEHIARDFPILMSQLVQRYFREKDSNVDTSGDDIDILKNELAELKQYIKEALEGRGTHAPTPNELPRQNQAPPRQSQAPPAT
ncbi:PREDICTED: short transient receptor potential channel 4-like [Nicrophorus vespilloides]|uniref:Short transient receptor potential channel 4-like n=1 Tax=Nicrophorus vespilloides TaxID=110193 RepID=A0ABM1MK88_NICVS|nr:PREDICTED: short transient receptor potential channel 4-like [Nicrophorus vespilloides]XP_017775330.1 PREDICTED: short transient receptor potential channel 4-like [Nicrophorus vespilloides]